MSNVVRVRLLSDAPVFALVSSRIYLLQLEQNCALPAISTLPVVEDPQVAIDGEVGLKNEMWQVDCYSKSYSEAESLADLVETAMAAAGTDFEAVRTDRGVLFENPTSLYRVSIDFSLWI